MIENKEMIDMAEANFFDYQVKDINGNMVSLDSYRGTPTSPTARV